MTSRLVLRVLVVLLWCALGECCARGSTSTTARPTTTTTTTTTTAAPPPVVEPGISAVTVPPVNAAPGGAQLSTSELQQLSESLWRSDEGLSQQPSVSIQGSTSGSATGDSAPNPLISSVSRAATSKETVRLMQALLDNYVPQTHLREDRTPAEQSEEDIFLNALMRTPVMTQLEQELKRKNLLSGTLRSKLKEIWFTPYKRGSRNPSSSGFEHVFVGEVRGGKVSGFHSWLNFRKEEQDGDLDYKGYIRQIDLQGKGKLIKMRFVWLNQMKPVGSVFIGTTPELEMGLYTLCFLAKPDARCPVQLAGKRFQIRTWTQRLRGKTVIGSAYPEI